MATAASSRTRSSSGEHDAADLTGRTFLVTGATSGVGRAAVRGLAARGGRVIGASRSGEAGDATVGVAMDLSDPASIRRAVDELKKEQPSLDGLVNAAGALSWQNRATAFGVDQAWAVNYLGHVLLTREVWPLLEAAPRAHVATVAGNPRFLQRVTVDPAVLNAPPRDPMFGASQAMAARVIWTRTLARRHRGGHVTPLAFHPGLVRSNLGRDAPWAWRFLGSVMNTWASPRCDIAVAAAVDPKLDVHAGDLIDPDGKAHHFKQLEDDRLGDELWRVTERLLA